jgi:hypothetical protein
MQSLRDVEDSKQQAHLLVYAKEQRTVREVELQSQLDLEREKNQVGGAKLNSLMRVLDAAEGRLVDMDEGSGLSGQREKELEVQLVSERERGAIAGARFNTMKAGKEREIGALMEKVEGLEGAVARGRAEVEAGKVRALLTPMPTPTPTATPSVVSVQDAGMMTSIDLTDLSHRRSPPQPPPTQPQTLPTHAHPYSASAAVPAPPLHRL